MNTIISCVVGTIGGDSGGAMLVLMFGAFIDPIVFPDEQPRDQSTIGNVTHYGAVCGAVIGLILVIGSGQRL